MKLNNSDDILWFMYWLQMNCPSMYTMVMRNIVFLGIAQNNEAVKNMFVHIASLGLGHCLNYEITAYGNGSLN